MSFILLEFIFSILFDCSNAFFVLGCAGKIIVSFDSIIASTMLFRLSMLSVLLWRWTVAKWYC